MIERMGKFHSIFEPGLNIMIPVIDQVKYIQSLKEIAIDIPQQSAITVDNVTLQIDGKQGAGDIDWEGGGLAGEGVAFEGLSFRVETVSTLNE